MSAIAIFSRSPQLFTETLFPRIRTSAFECGNADLTMLRSCDCGPSKRDFCTSDALSRICTRWDWDPELFPREEPRSTVFYKKYWMRSPNQVWIRIWYYFRIWIRLRLNNIGSQRIRIRISAGVSISSNDLFHEKQKYHTDGRLIEMSPVSTKKKYAKFGSDNFAQEKMVQIFVTSYYDTKLSQNF